MDSRKRKTRIAVLAVAILALAVGLWSWGRAGSRLTSSTGRAEIVDNRPEPPRETVVVGESDAADEPAEERDRPHRDNPQDDDPGRPKRPETGKDKVAPPF